MNILQKKMNDVILPKIKDEFGIKNVMSLPRLSKICLNQGLGQYHSEVKTIEHCNDELTLISGQKSVITYARKSEAGFKIREGMPVGARVTLRKDRMWNFLDRFINIASPRIRDFRGFSRKGFDARGNFSIGISEQSIFVEVDLDKLVTTQGMNITLVFENSSPEMSIRIIEEMSFPLEKN
ncbi:MAG: 50S ribosomal protein L5 [Planctomycetes bacterium]|nr:50S ribosomal protein L5 [Planctomycetota bacterium]